MEREKWENGAKPSLTRRSGIFTFPSRGANIGSISRDPVPGNLYFFISSYRGVEESIPLKAGLITYYRENQAIRRGMEE